MYVGIERRTKNVQYASVYQTRREGARVIKKKVHYLGKVIDMEKGVFENREKGVYTYDVKTDTFGKVSPDYDVQDILRKNIAKKRPILAFIFGDVYALHKYLENSGFQNVIDAIDYKNHDTLCSVLSYYVLSNDPNSWAINWYETSYCKFIYPNANMRSQRISEALADIGSEDAKRKFFRAYFKFLGIPGNGDGIGDEWVKNEALPKTSDKSLVLENGTLIDSTGLPNACKLPMTAVSNHNGEINVEARLIYVVKQDTGLPLYYRYIPGNVIDASTVKVTVKQLELMGIDINWALLDAGYYNGINADIFYDAGISFITRVEKSAKIFKDALKDHGSELHDCGNMVAHNNRLFYVVEVEVLIGKHKDKPAFAYLCVDSTERFSSQRHLLEKEGMEGFLDSEMVTKLETSGIFMLISNKQIPKDKILPLYYTRDQVEKAFEISKQHAKLLPLSIQTEETFRGHLLLTFATTTIWKMLGEIFSGDEISANSAFSLLARWSALVYPDHDEILVCDATRLQKKAYHLLNIEIPESLPIPPGIFPVSTTNEGEVEM